jgi:hypothetical protein
VRNTDIGALSITIIINYNILYQCQGNPRRKLVHVDLDGVLFDARVSDFSAADREAIKKLSRSGNAGKNDHDNRVLSHCPVLWKEHSDYNYSEPSINDPYFMPENDERFTWLTEEIWRV